KDSITSNIDETLLAARQNFEQALETVRAVALRLGDSRKIVFKQLCKQITKLLRELGMPNAIFETTSTTIDLAPSGMDYIEILFSANKGVTASPLAQVASGG